MPAWLINMLLPLAVRLGLEGLLSLFPRLPEAVRRILQDFIDALSQNRSRTDIPASEKKAERNYLVKETKKRIRNACNGVGCPTDLK